MNHLRQLIEKVAPTNSRVMISGPSGSGKEAVARAIHRPVARGPAGPFVVLNAAAITPERMEEELFGTEPNNGAGRRVGALEEAHGGTLYLDEVGDMPRETQNKILRVLVEQSFQRVGGATKVNVDVRIVSSTARDLEREIGEGHLPRGPVPSPRRGPDPRAGACRAARGHPGDGPPFHRPHLEVDRAAAAGRSPTTRWRCSRPTTGPETSVSSSNNVERLLILARGDAAETITAEMLPAEIGEMLPTTPGRAGGEHLMSMPLRDAREIFEREYLRAQVNRFGGNISRTAEFVGMERSALHRKLKSLGVG